MLSKHILSIELSFSLCLHLGLAFCLPGLCRSMAPLSPLPPFPVPLPLPLPSLLPLSPVPVRDRLPANVLVVLCACRSVGNKLSPTILSRSTESRLGVADRVGCNGQWQDGQSSGTRPPSPAAAGPRLRPRGAAAAWSESQSRRLPRPL
jgi:hypothetical protein